MSEPFPRIIIVEDEALIALELRDRLSQLGYQVARIHARGEDALADEAAASVELALMDINLAGQLDGIETARRLRAQHGTGIVFLSAYSDATLLERARQAEPLGYLVKPFEERELHATLQTALLRHRLERARLEFTLQLEQRVAERTSELERANAAKSEFLSRMSHELRTPLNAVLGFAQLLQLPGGSPLSERQASHVRNIQVGGEHLLQLINEVLDLARIESGPLEVNSEPVALQPLIETCVAQTESLARARRIAVTLPPADPCTVQADPLRLQQVLLNLLSNAVKYNREGGSIEIDCVPVAGQRVRVSVRDSGRGLSAEQQARLFRPFERLESAYDGIDGTGIGLALVKRLVEAMGGDVGVESEVGVGSTFWFELPLCDAPAPADTSPAAAGAGASPRGGKRTVLYVEDNTANLRLMQKILSRRADIELLAASNADDGLVQAARARPDLILLDINLPGMDGFAALQRLRADPATRAIPVIAVTSNAMPRDIERGRAAGFSDYVTKPIDVAGFLETLDRCLPWRKEDKA